MFPVLICLARVAFGADPLDQWTWRDPLPARIGLHDIAYGNGQFVAAGSGGTILTSPDGMTWNSHSSGTTADLSVVAYANGQFFVLASGTFLGLTSLDGLRWTMGPSGTGKAFLAIAYVNNQFVAVGSSGGGNTVGIWTSPDAATWTVRYEVSTGNLGNAGFSGIAYGKNRVVAVGGAIPSVYGPADYGWIATSSDGITWTNTTPMTSGATPRPSTHWLFDVAYGDSQFVTVGDSGTIATSSDGITWTSRTVGTTSFSSIAYGNDEFVAVGSDASSVSWGSTILSSPNGITWNRRSWMPFSTVTRVAFGNNEFVAVGYDAYGAGTVLTSPDAVTWTLRSSALRSNAGPDWFRSIVYADNQYVAVGGVLGVLGSGATWKGPGVIVSSCDGSTWTVQNSGTSNYLLGVTCLNDQLVAVGRLGTILTSTDGVNWASRTSGTTNVLYSVAYGNNRYVAVGDARTIATSPDGITWTVQESETLSNGWPGDVFTGVAYGGGLFVATRCGPYFCTIQTSADGTTWAVRDSEASGGLSGVAYGHGRFVAVGDTILVSADGITWARNPPGLSKFLNAIAYVNNQFVAVGDGGTLLTSPDGMTWISHTLGTDCNLSGIAYGASRFVAVSDGGAILQSGVVAPARSVLGPILLLSSGAVRASLAGTASRGYAIQASADLTSWLTITNVVLTNTPGEFVDPSASNFHQRFYRALAGP